MKLQRERDLDNFISLAVFGPMNGIYRLTFCFGTFGTCDLGRNWSF